MRTRRNDGREKFKPDKAGKKKKKKTCSLRSFTEVRHTAGHLSELLTWETDFGDRRLSRCCRRPPERREEKREKRKVLKINKYPQ